MHVQEEKNGHRVILARTGIDVGPTWKKFIDLQGEEVSFAGHQYLLHSSAE